MQVDYQKDERNKENELNKQERIRSWNEPKPDENQDAEESEEKSD